MPGGLIRNGVFNRRAASAISGVESCAKARDNDSAVMLRSCAPLAGFAKGTDISELRIQRQQSGCGFLPNVRMGTYEAVDRTSSRLLRNRELGVGKSRRQQ